MMNKCIFLDRDGVLNVDNPNFVYRIEDFVIPEGVPEAIQLFKTAGYLLIIITNQSGIDKGIYTKEDVLNCYQYLQEKCNYMIDDHYFAPYHPNFSESLSRKPDSLMIEKAIAKYRIDVLNSWMIGDHERDIVAAQKQNLKTVWIVENEKKLKEIETKKNKADLTALNLYDACLKILKG